MPTPILKVEMFGLRDLLGRFAKADTRLTEEVRERGRDLGRRVVERLQATAPVKTGVLRQGIRYRTALTQHGIELRLTSQAKHTLFVIYPTRPHIIRPVKARVLHFFVDGREVFTRIVHHPGTKANPFVARVLNEIDLAAEAGRLSRRADVIFQA